MNNKRLSTTQIVYAIRNFACIYLLSTIFMSCDPTAINSTNDKNQPIDGDNNSYATVLIGDQTWMAENLKTTKYNDGTDIPLITENEDWKTFGIGAGYCWYQNNELKNKGKYGALYNWQVIVSEKACPLGWHVPSQEEWLELYNYLDKNGHHDSTGIVLKSTTGWTNQWGIEQGNGTNDYLFNAVPAGARTEMGAFTNSGMNSVWWSSNESSKGFSYTFSLSYAHKEFVQGTSYQSCERSVRCIKDELP